MVADMSSCQPVNTKGANELDDGDILRRSLTDPEAFELLVQKYEGRLLHRAFGITRNHEEAKDLVQETFLRLYCNAEKYHMQKGSSFSAWVSRILFNLAMDHLRKRKLLLELDESIASEEDPVSNSENRLLLEDAISQLTPREQFIFIQSDVRDESRDEVGRKLGYESGSFVSTQRTRLLKKLRKILAD